MLDPVNAPEASTPEAASATELAIALRDQLATAKLRLVLVESCTAGGVAACLGLLPGISQWMCGSLVVYRSASKSAWLGVPQALLDDPRQGPVSSAASSWLARAALTRTPEADLAIAITGDVGPGAPAATDGYIFLAAARRPTVQLAVPTPQQKMPSAALDQPLDSVCLVKQWQQRLANPTPRDSLDIAGRQARLEEATKWTLKFATDVAAEKFAPS